MSSQIQPSQNTSNCNWFCNHVISNIALVAGITLVVIGILAAAKITGLQSVSANWYSFEIAALPCFIFKIITCCRSGKEKKTSSSSIKVGSLEKHVKEEPVPNVTAATYDNIPDHSEGERLFIEGEKHREKVNYRDARECYEKAWRQGYVLAGFQLASTCEKYCSKVWGDQNDSKAEAIYKNLAAQNYLEAMFILAFRGDLKQKIHWLEVAVKIDPDEQRAQSVQKKIKELKMPIQVPVSRLEQTVDSFQAAQLIGLLRLQEEMKREIECETFISEHLLKGEETKRKELVKKLVDAEKTS
jgi:tetratricopeptide (TPR) repeat protein